MSDTEKLALLDSALNNDADYDADTSSVDDEAQDAENELEPIELDQTDTQNDLDELTPSADSNDEITDSKNDVDVDSDLVGLSERGKKRFQDLAANNRTLNEQVQQFNNLRHTLNDSIGSPEEFIQILDYAKAAKEGRYQDALTLLDQARSQIIIRGGLDVAAHDPLNDYPDLSKKVDDFTLSRADALEIARSRFLGAERERLSASQSNEQQQQVIWVQAAEQAAQGIATLEAQWRQSDPDYEHKIKAITAQVDSIRHQYHPNQWLSVVKMLYESQAAAMPRKINNQPLRSTPNTKSSPKTPANSQEAMFQALGWD